MAKTSKKNPFINEVIATGKVVSITPGTHRSSVRIVTKNGNIDTYPLFFCNAEQCSNLRVGDHVRVRGCVEVYFKKSASGEIQRRQCFVATKIEKALTMCEEKFGVKGKFWESPTNAIYISGELKSQSVRADDWMSLNLQVSESDRDVVKINMKKLDRQPEINKGDVVCIRGGISTVNKSFGDKKMHFENIIVSDIGVIPNNKK